jgi:hypothetical protein
MKKFSYKKGMLFLPFLLLPLMLAGQEVTKEFHKEYQAGDNTMLNISNRYGEVIIESWDKPQIVIDVKVTVEMPNQEKAQKLLDYITVEFNEGDNNVTAKTVIDDKFNFSGWGNNRKFSIDYNVKMPVKSNLTLSNRYGNSEINELQGLVNLNIRYGKISIGKLTRMDEKPLNKLNLSYGDATIDEAGWLDLYLRYAGKTEIGKSKALLLDAKYSRLTIDETSSIVGNFEYNNMQIEQINNLILENHYADIKIGSLLKKLEYDGSYGSFQVETIPANFESIKVDTRYSGVKLGIEDGANYYLNAKVSYGGVEYNKENFKNQRRIIENTSQEIEGLMGDSDKPKASVNIEASYANVKLF